MSAPGTERHTFRPVRLRTVSGRKRVAASCSCGWRDPEHYELESSAWEAWDEHAGTIVVPAAR